MNNETEVTVDIPDEIYTELIKEASIRNVDINTYVNYTLCSYLAKDKDALISTLDKIRNNCSFFDLGLFMLAFKTQFLNKPLQDVDLLISLEKLFKSSTTTLGSE